MLSSMSQKPGKTGRGSKLCLEGVNSMSLQEAIALCRSDKYKVKDVREDSAVVTKLGRSLALTIIITIILIPFYIFPAVIYVVYVIKRKEKVYIRATSDENIVAEPMGNKTQKDKEIARRLVAVGKVYFCLKDYAKAIESFENASSHSYLPPKASSLLVKSYEMIGMTDKAKEMQEEASYRRFVSRGRIKAWIIDVIIPSTILTVLFSIAEISMNETISTLATLLWLIDIAYFLTKDALFGGRSIGKRIFGLAVVDDETGKPCKFSQSFGRNIPLMVPIVPLIAADEVIRGHSKRIGESWVRTRVIKYKPNIGDV